jgi:hypothetical protein
VLGAPAGGGSGEIAFAPGTVWRRLLTQPETGLLVKTDPTTYKPTADTARQVLARDQHCAFPTCRMPAHRCDLDRPHGPHLHQRPTHLPRVSQLTHEPDPEWRVAGGGWRVEGLGHHSGAFGLVAWPTTVPNLPFTLFTLSLSERPGPRAAAGAARPNALRPSPPPPTVTPPPNPPAASR